MRYGLYAIASVKITFLNELNRTPMCDVRNRAPHSKNSKLSKWKQDKTYKCTFKRINNWLKGNAIQSSVILTVLKQNTDKLSI